MRLLTLLSCSALALLLLRAESCHSSKLEHQQKLDSMAMTDSLQKALAAQQMLDSIDKASLIVETDSAPTRPNHPPALPIEPTYKEGRDALAKFISGNLHYPADALAKKIQGNVIVMFMVHKDGTLSSFKIQQGLGYGCDEEALRIAKLMPNWNPGKKDGVPVDMEYMIIVPFTLK